MFSGLKKFSSEKNLSSYLKSAIFQRHLDTIFSKKINANTFKPQVEDVYFRLGEIYLNANRTAKMKIFFEKYALNSELKKENSDQVFTAFCLLGDFKKAFSRELTEFLDKAEVIFDKMEFFEGMNPFSKLFDTRHAKFLALQMKKYLRKNPENSRAKFYELLIKLKISGDTEQIAEDIERLELKNKKIAAFANYVTGSIFLNKMKFSSALSNFKKVLQAFPKSETVNGKTAETLLCLGKIQKALVQIKKAFRAINHAGLKAWEGELLLLNGRYKESLPVLRYALKKNCVFAYCWLGVALFKLGKISQALKNFNQAIKFNPRDYEAKIWLCEIHIRLGNFKEALSQANDILSLNRGNFWAYINKASVFCEMGNLKHAQYYFKQIPCYIRNFIAKRCGYSQKNLNLDKIRESIFEIKKLSKGNRRMEKYMQKIWMKF
ncbi:MAG: tetratricopeptide repeat protein [Elusimicrobia bacterium]|nr:tetratricopeptide repeat protein [Elusimicrobiota bacterium]